MFTPTSFLIGCIAAFLIGLSKTGVPGMGTASVVIMVYAFPGLEKQSTGAVLPLLILGDCFGVFFHRRKAQWAKLRSLFPPVLIGLVLGAFVLNFIDNAQFKILIGGTILLLLAFEALRTRLKWNSLPDSRFFTWFMGGTAGFTTLIGNAAGPVMSVYMAAQKLSKEDFMGTWAWFFLCVNVSKLPFMIGLGMITLPTLKFDAMLVPAVVFGSIVGKKLFLLIPEKYFVKIVVILNVLPPIGMVTSPLVNYFRG